jgi:hypothetical protein
MEDRATVALQNQGHASVSSQHTAATNAKEGENEYDAFFTGDNDKPEWLLTHNRDANPFRSLTPYGQVNPHNPLATLIPPKDAVTVDNNPHFRFMGAYNPNREAVKPFDLETHAILAFLELKSEELSRQAKQERENKPFDEPVALLQVDAKGNDDDDYNGVGGNANNAFYGAGGKGPAWVLPVEPLGAPFRSRTGTPLQNIRASDKPPVQMPPMGVASAESLSPEERYMPLFDRPSSAYGAGPFSFLEIERHERIVELQKEFEQWYANGGYHVAQQRVHANTMRQ